MKESANQQVAKKGMEVYGSDGERIGKVDGFDQEFMVVNKGLMQGEIYVPTSVISRVEAERGIVVLAMPSAEVNAEDWTTAAEGTTMTLGNTPAEHRTDALNQVSTTAQPGKDAVVDADTDAFDDRPDMDTNRRPDDARPETKRYRPSE